MANGRAGQRHGVATLVFAGITWLFVRLLHAYEPICGEHQGDLLCEGSRRGAVFTVALPPSAIEG